MGNDALIAAKIHTKEEEIKACSQIGPWAVTIIGILAFIAVSWIIGGIIVAAGCVWGVMRENQQKKLKNEIKDLEILRG